MQLHAAVPPYMLTIVSSYGSASASQSRVTKPCLTILPQYHVTAFLSTMRPGAISSPCHRIKPQHLVLAPCLSTQAPHGMRAEVRTQCYLLAASKKHGIATEALLKSSVLLACVHF